MCGLQHSANEKYTCQPLTISLLLLQPLTISGTGLRKMSHCFVEGSNTRNLWMSPFTCTKLAIFFRESIF